MGRFAAFANRGPRFVVLLATIWPFPFAFPDATTCHAGDGASAMRGRGPAAAFRTESVKFATAKLDAKSVAKRLSGLGQ